MAKKKYMILHNHGVQLHYQVNLGSAALQQFIEESLASSSDFRNKTSSWYGDSVKALLEILSGQIANDCIGLDRKTLPHFANEAIYGSGRLLNALALEFDERPIEVTYAAVHSYTNNLDWTIHEA